MLLSVVGFDNFPLSNVNPSLPIQDILSIVVGKLTERETSRRTVRDQLLVL